MLPFRITIVGLLALLTTLASGSKCPQDSTNKFVVCYYKGEVSLKNFNICNCTHIIFTNGVRRLENNSLTITEDAKNDLAIIRERKSELLTLFTVETKLEESSFVLKSENRTGELINGVVEFLQEVQFDGVELDFRFRSDDGVLRESYASFVKDLSKALPSRHPRVKREGYDVFEKLQDDVTTASYPTQTPKNGTHKAQSISRRNRKKDKNNRKTREEKEKTTQEPEDSVTLEEAINREFAKVDSGEQTKLKDLEEGSSVEESKYLIFVRLSIQPEVIAKKFDLKTISRYADILTVPTHDIVNKNEERLTYHPSRLMGLADILNTDSILDFLTGMGALKSKIVISFPATVLKFQLKDSNKNTPRSASVTKPQIIDQSQMCSLFSKSNWTIERDDDLTAPYAFSGKTWLAFEDETSIKIKGKYILLRELAGGAVYPIDADDNEKLCANNTGSGGYLTGILYKNFKSLERKPRALVLESLQEQIHDTGFTNIEAGVKLSEYRIVRVVDHSGAVHVIRKNTKTQFECSRQGYFSHPLGCNKFYRCVKFDQYSDEFTVFEYDCPAGLAFDERWEVCVWPGSLPHGAPCTGSSEIAPVPRSHYQCPNHEGYYADPENCRWFFACLDHARDGITPLTAYEFRCPFGLVFNEERLACDWPWLVGACGNRGAAGYLQVNSGAQSQGIFSATFINGGNLAASSGQYGNTEHELAFNNFGKGFGSVLKEADKYTAKGSYPAQSAGFGYIASQFDDNGNRGSFASFPEYEISGGRILNKGGLVLNEHVNIGSGSGAAVGAGILNKGGALLNEHTSFGGASGAAVGAGILNKGGVVFNEHINTGGVAVGGGLVHEQLNAGGAAGTTFGTGILSKGSAIVNEHTSFGGASGAAVGAGILNKGGAVLSEHSSFRGASGSTVSGGGILNKGGTVFKEHVNSGGVAIGGGLVHEQVNTGGAAFAGILNKGGVLLTEHVNSEGATGSAVGSGGVLLNQQHVSFGGASGAAAGGSTGFGYRENVQSTFGNSQISEIPEIEFQKLTPAPGIAKATVVQTGGLSSGAHVSFQSPISTPKPFSVHIPSVQINEEKHSGFSAHSNIQSTTPQTLLVTEQGSIQNNGASFGTSTVSLDVTSKPQIHRFGTTSFKQADLSVTQPTITPIATKSFQGTLGSGTVSVGPPVSVGIPVVTPKPTVQTFEYTTSGHGLGVGLGVSQPSISVGSPSVGFTKQSVTGQGNVYGQSAVSFGIPTVAPTVQTHVFKNTNTGSVSGVKQSTASYGVPVVSSFTSGQSGSAGSVLTVTPKPVLHNLQQTSVDKEIFTELNFNYKVPSVTPKTEFGTFSHTGSGLVSEQLDVKLPLQQNTGFDSFTQFGAKSFGGDSQGKSTASFVTPKTDVNTFSYTSGISVTPVVPVVTPTYNNVFEQAGSGGTAKEFSKVSFGITPKSEISTFGQKFFHSSTGNFQTVTPATNAQTVLQSGGVSPSFVKSDVEVSSFSQPVQPVVGQQFSYSTSFKNSGNQFASIAPFAQTPKPVFNKQEVVVQKVEKPKTITHVSIEQQPIVSVGTITSFGFDHGASTPKSFTQNSGVSSYNFKTTYHQPKQQISVTTPTPVVSVTATPPVVQQPTGASVFAKTPLYKQEVKLQPELSLPGIQESFGQKTFDFNQNFNQEITQGVHVTSSRPITYQQDVNSKSGFFEQKVFVPPVTPKIEVFKPNFQQTTQVLTSQFGSAGKDQITLHQEPYQPVNFEFVKTKPLIHTTEQKVQHIQQVPVQVTTPAPEFKNIINSVTTAQEGLLDISKSVELNPSQFFQSNNVYSPAQSTAASPVVIQKQPVRLLSQKTFPEKSVIQPFYKQTSFTKEEVVQGQINTIPEIRYEDQFAFHKQEVQKPTPNDYLPPAVTPKSVLPPFSYSTTKTTIIDQPVYSVTPSVQTSGLAFTGQKQTLVTGDYLSPVAVVKNPPKPIVVAEHLGVTPKDNLLPYTEDITIQQHNNFDFQKVNSYKGSQNLFSEAYPTLKPAVNVFKTSGQLFQSNVQNFTSGSNSLFGTGVKYAVNPNIAIPEPPKEYLLGQNVYTTVAPQVSTTTLNHIQSTTSAPTQYKGTTYLPPVSTRRRPSSKATVISVGNVDEHEIHEDNIQQILDKYSGRFGEVINGDKEKFVTKVIEGDGRGEIELGRVGSSTVRYEINSGTSKQKSRGRQYHGGITSGIQATNKYEEYEIESDKEGQRSFVIDKSSSKATIDLKNLKLDKNKKTVIVVSQVSDANPILVGKLAGQCSCQSNMLELRSKSKKSSSKGRRPPVIYNEFLPPFSEDKENIVSGLDTQGGISETVEVTPETVVIGGSRSTTEGISYSTEQNIISSTTVLPEVSPSTILSSLGPNGVLPIAPKTLYSEDRIKNKKKQFRGRTRFLPPASLFEGSAPLLSPVPASEIASTVDYPVLKGDESRTQNEIDGGRAGGPKYLAGAAFDRYGPGGWRSFDETLEASVDCKRPGLFRHPKYCNKFYACNYDPWKEKYTLHVFNCPIHLTYDSSITACNWPVRGPACADDNLLV